MSIYFFFLGGPNDKKNPIFKAKDHFGFLVDVENAKIYFSVNGIFLSCKFKLKGIWKKGQVFSAILCMALSNKVLITKRCYGIRSVQNYFQIPASRPDW